MNLLTTVAAFIGILTGAIGYGTDVFEALVQRPRSPWSTTRPSLPSWAEFTSTATSECPSRAPLPSWRRAWRR